ncbi:MAG: transporter substrate-binding domain-containing protein [Oligoflexus sp.]
MSILRPLLSLSFVFFCQLGFWNNLAQAQEQSVAEILGKDTLVVGTRVAPPFAMQDQKGDWYGFSIDIWREIAQNLGMTFEIRDLALEELLDSLATGSIDVAVGALTVTPDREIIMDFTHPIHRSGFAMVVLATGRSPWLATIAGFFSWQFFQAIIGLFLILFLAGAAIWLFERHKNPEQFGGSPAAGLGNGLWWSAVTMTTVGYGDRVPVSLGGRVIGLIWMFASIIIISGITASITASLTVNNLTSNISSIDDLRKERVATLRGSVSESFLQTKKIGDLVYFETVESSLDAVLSGEVAAMVYDTPILSYWLQQAPYQQKLHLIATNKNPQLLAFAVPEGSRLREFIDRTLLEYMQSPIWEERQRMYGLLSP